MSEWKPLPEELRTVEYLAELHAQVKAHPYRISGKGLQSYKELLWRMSDIFYYVIKPTKYTLAKGMGHDFNKAVGNLGRKDYKYSANNDLHVENCISVIHDFIDTGTVPKYYSYYEGEIGVLNLEGPIMTFLWNEELQGYYLKVTPAKLPEFKAKVRKWMNRITDARKDSEASREFIKTWEEVLSAVEKYNTKE